MDNYHCVLHAVSYVFKLSMLKSLQDQEKILQEQKKQQILGKKNKKSYNNSDNIDVPKTYMFI